MTNQTPNTPESDPTEPLNSVPENTMPGSTVPASTEPANTLPFANTQAPGDAASFDASPTFTGPAFTNPTPPKKNRKPLIAISIATAAVVGIGGLGTAGLAFLSRPTTSTSSSKSSAPFNFYNQGYSQGQRQLQGGGFQGGQGTQGSSGSSGSSGLGATESAAIASTAAEKVGVVTIKTDLNFGSGEAAGTGMIISSDGLILTNNHVVEESTSIEVTVESTGKTYKANVVGTDKTKDVAILQLVGASNLSTVKFASSEAVKVGQAIHSVGNAEGTGDLVTAKGTVGAVNQNLSIQSDFSTEGENLTGLIQLNSDVVSGDSGGPLFDSSGKVIGIVTAASSGSATVTGYAINIASVLKVAKVIEAGKATSEVVIGTPAFLGIQLAQAVSGSTAAGVTVQGTFAGMPAAKAGITAGSTITSVDGTAITTATQLSALIAAHKVGDTVTVHWTTATGVAHSAVVTLVGGPAA
jgi:S1-C subfamily serine protease